MLLTHDAFYMAEGESAQREMKRARQEDTARVLATVHPASLLRQPDEAAREREYAYFVADLCAALKASAAT